MVTRAEITKARADVKAAKSKIKETRGQVAGYKEDISTESKKLIRKKRVPFTPRRERISRSKFRQQLGSAGAELSEAERQLASQEGEIQQYERGTLAPAERELKEIARD